MGRLTLNVLLSFAQFEREVTGERIRDKIAASKKKGIWMGGVVPFGYRVEDRKLLIDEKEAAVVRLIFDLYLEHGSLPAVQRELNARQIVSRSRTYTTGRSVGGAPFSNGALSHILKNRHYIADLNHRGKSWPGEHQPIVEVGVFSAVEEKLAAQKQRRSKHVLSTESLLMGKIFLESGERMSPSYAMKKGVRYRYYLARSIIQGQRGVPRALGRLPAEPLEKAVASSLRSAVHQCDRPSGAANLGDGELIDAYLDRVEILPNALMLTLKVDGNADEPTTRLTVPWIKPEAVRRREIILPEAGAARPQPIRVNEQARLVRAIATARRWVDEIIAGAVPDTAALAKREEKTERSIRMALSLAFLDPMLIKAACEGRLPRGYGVSRLVDLPADFAEQWNALGLPRPA